MSAKLKIMDCQEELLKSELNEKIHTKMAVFSFGLKSSLSIKVYSMLKREYSVVHIQNACSAYSMPVIELKDLEKLQAYLLYNEIKILVLSSEWLSYLHTSGEEEELFVCLKKLILICNQIQVKVIYLSAECLFERQFIYGNWYQTANCQMEKSVLMKEENLVIRLPVFYGYNDYENTVDFPEYVHQRVLNKQPVVCPEDIQVSPMLIDVIALFVCKNVYKSGLIKIDNENRKISILEWAKLIIKATGIEGELSLLQSDGRCESEKKFLVADCKKMCNDLQIPLKQASCVFNLVYKLSPLEFFKGRRVAECRIQLGKKLAEIFDGDLLNRIDYVVPVPQTGIYYAIGVSQIMQKAYLQALFKNTNEVRSFQLVDANVRKEIINNKVVLMEELLRDKSILLVDEAIFTGTTLKIICKKLRACGVKEIHLGIPTPKCVQQCTYYMQPRRAMLLEYVREDMLTDYFDVDSITFQDIDTFKDVLSCFGDLCMKCFENE